MLALIFFVFAISKSLAMTGTIDTSVENKVKICKDVTCTNPAPGIIDFNMNDGFPIVIDTEKGVSGKAWGGEFGWINFDGVFFADPAIGVLKGVALSTTSGIINFFVTGQKVIIDPATGEWDGWAWASGPHGGWIKFDCKANSCVRIIWNDKAKTESSPIPGIGETGENRFLNLFDKAGKIIIYAYDYLSYSLIDFRNSFLNKIDSLSPPVVVPVLNAPALETNMGEKISVVSYTTFLKPGEILKNVLNNFSVSFANLFNKTTETAVNAYDFLSSFLINLKNLFFIEIGKVFKLNS